MNAFMSKEVFAMDFVPYREDPSKLGVIIILAGAIRLDESSEWSGQNEGPSMVIGFPIEGTQVPCIHGGINSQYENVLLEIETAELIFSESIIGLTENSVLTEIECVTKAKQIKSLWKEELESRAERLLDMSRDVCNMSVKQ